MLWVVGKNLVEKISIFQLSKNASLFGIDSDIDHLSLVQRNLLG